VGAPPAALRSEPSSQFDFYKLPRRGGYKISSRKKARKTLVHFAVRALQLLKSKDTHMSESTITAKGQTTVPAQVRERMGAAAGTKLVWHVLPDGNVFVRAKSKSILDLAGMLKPPKGTHVAIKDMDAWR
jgi:AbrB family looped-hinge helix DNA binding protein